MSGPRFTEEDLYRGRDNLPRARDIQQDNLNDCYLVAPMGSMAQLQPDRIRNAISYDPTTTNFNVTLYRDNGGSPEAVVIPVSQADLRDNLNRGGGSTVDNAFLGLRDSPIWPAVMETAYARMHDSNPADGLDEGYQKIEWGNPRNAMYALTGEHGTDIEPAQAATLGANAVAQRMSDALAQGRPVTLGTMPEPGAAQDGLQDLHAFMVQGVTHNRAGDPILQLRNPLAHNNGSGEGRDHGRATTEVNLREMMDSGGFWGANIGPGPVPSPAPTRESAYDPNGPTKTGNPHIDTLFASMNDPAAMRQALAGLANSPEGQAIRADNQAQWQAQQTQAATQSPRTQDAAATPPPQPHNEEQAPRVMRM